MPKKQGDVSADLLRWYDANGRSLPWRVKDGSQPDPYGVWLSEVMLQQTQVTTVIPYFERFLALWPDVKALAAAPVEAVLRAWAGLGYYSRARNLHACAQLVVAQHGGRFPESEDALRALPGIGAYTAAAIAAIAFDQRAVVVDGNIERVVARLFTIETPLPDARPEIRAAMDRLTPAARCGDFAQAMMDLGARICTPRTPDCIGCPVRQHCASRDAAEHLPRKKPKAARPSRQGVAWWLEADGHVWLRRRAKSGLLGGMVEMPGSAWVENADITALLNRPPLAAPWHLHPERAHHVFTHFALELHIAFAKLDHRIALEDGWWYPLHDLGNAGLPTALAKVAKIMKDSSPPLGEGTMAMQKKPLPN